MRFKNFKIGKSKEKPEKDGGGVEDTTVQQIAEMEEKINGRTKNLKKTAQQLQGLSGGAGSTKADEDIPAKPHGPLVELTIEPEDKLADVDDIEAGEDVLEGSGEGIKIVEVSVKSTPPPAEKKEVKLDDTSDSINKLFSDDSEEENLLANLIKSLPDVTVEELIDDLNEIKGIIKEWQKS